MTMTMDPQQRQFGSLGYEHAQYSSPPQFTNPWSSTTSTNTNSHLFPSNNAGYGSMMKQQPSPTAGVSMPYSSMSSSTSTMPPGNSYSGSAYGQPNLLGMSQDLLNPARSSYEQSYTSAPPSSIPSYAPTSAPYNYAHLLHPQLQQDRRLSQSSSADSHVSYDALDAGRGMVAMSQDMTTPRNIYDPRNDRTQTDAYGFPSAHSSASSVSSASTYPYYAESTGSSVTDYSSSSESMEPSSGSRRLPRPSGLIAGIPPAPQTMMGQFNSKVSSSTQKKHKCKVCQKAFTRPSSLQTHIYSHTGEKPYACGFEGCGRQFSVVSNLRRHRKVHKADRLSHPSSPEGSWISER